MSQVSHAGSRSTRMTGFTLIELLVVLVIIGIISSIGIGAMMKAMQRSRVVAAAEAVIRVHNEARARAIASKPTFAESSRMYGMALMPSVNGQSAYAVLLHGNCDTDIAMVDVSGSGSTSREVLKVPLGIGIEPIVSHEADGNDPEPLTSPLIWWYSWGSGDPVPTTASVMPMSVGTHFQAARQRQTGATAYGDWGTNDLLTMATPEVSASAVCSYLGFRQGKIRVALQIYPLGPVSWEIDQ